MLATIAHRFAETLRVLRQSTYRVLEREVPGDVAAVVVHRLLILFILCNVAGSVIDTIPWVNARYDPYFDAFESASLILFSIEYILRFWAAGENPFYRHRSPWLSRWIWFRSPAGLIDLLAVAPFIVSQLFDIDLRVIVLIRLMRFFKIARYSPGFRSLLDAVRTERHALAACLVILSSVILVSAGLTYVVEHDAQPDKFGSIPDAMWWAAATVSTVGYGDVVPITPAGRIIGVFTMMIGLLMLALPAGIIATAFASFIMRHNFVVTGSMVARMPIFKGIAAPTIINLLPKVSTRSFDRGTHILHPGAGADSLYLITEGIIELERDGRRMKRGPGAAFGGDRKISDLSVRAVSHARMLVIDAHEIAMLCQTFPRLRKRIVDLNDIKQRTSPRDGKPRAPAPTAAADQGKTAA